MTEEWRAIDGFPGYEVSNLGRVKSFHRNKTVGKILVINRARKSKRATIMLYRDEKPYTMLVARLLCRAFHGPAPTDEHQAAHADDDVLNDTVGNIRWATRAENYADRDANGKTMRGARHYAAKMTVEQVIEIRKKYDEAKAAGMPLGFVTALTRQYNAPLGRIEAIIYRRSWRSVA